MARHQPNILMCRSLPGHELGQVCANCEGRCILCDSQSGLNTTVHICDDCANSATGSKCLLCHANSVAKAQYCDQCVELEYDRDGCPRVQGQTSQRVAKHFLGKNKAEMASKGKNNG